MHKLLLVAFLILNGSTVCHVNEVFANPINLLGVNSDL